MGTNSIKYNRSLQRNDCFNYLNSMSARVEMFDRKYMSTVRLPLPLVGPANLAHKGA